MKNILDGITRMFETAEEKIRTWVTNIENKLKATKAGSGSGMNSEVGIDIYTSLYIKQVTNEYLLHVTGNSAQFSVVSQKGSKSLRVDICMCMTDSLHFTAETNITL